MTVSPVAWIAAGASAGILSSIVIGGIRKRFHRPSSCDISLPSSELVDDPKMVFLIRTELKMDKGKVAAQCCHACLRAYQISTAMAQSKPGSMAHRALASWEHYGEKKITLKVQTLDELESLYKAARARGIPTTIITDAGHTQIPAGSKTVAALGPWDSADLDEITGHLKLY